MLARLHAALRYGVAALAVLLAAALHDAFEAYWGGRMPFLTFYPAVMGVAWFAGAGPGILATVLSSVLSARIWMAVHGSDGASVGYLIALGLFVATGISVSLLVAARDRARASV